MKKIILISFLVLCAAVCVFSKSYAGFSDSWTIDTQQEWDTAVAVKTYIDTVVNTGSIQIDYNNANILNNDFEQPYTLGSEPTYWTNIGNRLFVLVSSPVYHGNYATKADTAGGTLDYGDWQDRKLKVSVLDDYNNLLWSNTYVHSSYDAWENESFMLSQWKGQTIKIKFETVKWDGNLSSQYGSLISLPFLCSGGNLTFNWRLNRIDNYYARYYIDFLQGGKAEYYTYTTSTYVSPVRDTGFSSPRWKLFSADYTTNGQTVNFSARSADSPGGITSATWYSVTNNSDMSNVPRKRHIQWKIEMSTSSVSISPLINSVNIQWWTNTEPALSWSNVSSYWNCGVSPLAGKPGEFFTYKVKYSDVDNDPPKSGYPKVYIKRNGVAVFGSPMTMLEEDPSDVTYTDGKMYYYTIQFTPEGDYTCWFEAYDEWTYQGNPYNTLATGDPITEKSGPQIKRYAPLLAWHTTFKGHRDKGIGQLSISVGTNSHFEVDYSDPDNYAPTYVRLHILNNGVDIAGSPFDMNIGSNLPYDYTKGVNYYYNYVINTESNSYTYYFEAKNTFGDLASGEPTVEHEGPDVSNNSPYWLHTGEAGYTADSYEPNTGTSNVTTFNFRIKYTDFGNLPPASGWPKIYFYKVNDVDTGTNAGLYASYTMIKDNPSDNIYSDGCIYKYSTTLPGGEWSYRIMAYNTANWGARSDVGGGVGGECPYDLNDQNAYIFVSTVPQLTLDQVNTTWGNTNTNFVFTVKYSDSDSDHPMVGYYQSAVWYTDIYPKLRILKDGSEISGSPFLMNAVGSDIDYGTGKDYTYSKTFLSGGDYVYYFEAKDKLGWQTKTNTKTFQVSSGNPVITWCTDSGYVNGRNPTCGDTSTSFTWRIRYQDSDNDPPKSGYPKVHISRNGIEIDTSAMNEEAGGSYSGGKYFSYSRSLPTNNANYSYRVEVYDQQNWGGQGDAGNTVTAKFVSQKPEEPKDVTQYPGQVTTSKLTLKWQSADPDGDTLIYKVYISTDGNNWQLVYTGTKTEYTLENLKDGAKYYWKVEAEDSSGQKTTMTTSSFTVAGSTQKLCNWPNPFNPKKESTNIVFYSGESGNAKIIIYSEFGEKLWEKDVSVSAGSTSSVSFDGKDSWGNVLENGTYNVYVIKPGNQTEKHIILILKK